MAQLRVALIGLLLLLQPVVAFVLDVWLFGRPTEPREWVGLALSLAGIFMASLKGRSRLPEQPPSCPGRGTATDTTAAVRRGDDSALDAHPGLAVMRNAARGATAALHNT